MDDWHSARKHAQTNDADALEQTIERTTTKRIDPDLQGPPAAAPMTVELPSRQMAGPIRSDDTVKMPGNGPGMTGQPSRIGRYLVLRSLGAGGMGVVYAGYDEELDRKVAIKFLHPAAQGDTQLQARIIREAQALARVSAPNVVHVYEVGEFAGQLFISMEFVNGTTLTKWQAEQGRSWQSILRQYLAAGQGLLDAHMAGLVHRDFKPDNVLVGQDGRPRVADFGLARIQNPVGGPGTNAASARDQEGGGNDDVPPPLNPLTQTGAVMGTPYYMAPEQHLGEVADSRSDQFSFCVALYEALYHQLPFAGSAVNQLGFNKLQGNILPRPASSSVPTAVHEALLRGLAATPDQRYPSMGELLAALSFDPTSDTATAPHARRWIAVIVPSCAVLYMLGLPLLRWLGVSELAASVAASGILSLLYCLIPLRFRRVMATNRFHRGVTIIGVVSVGQLFWLRVVGIVLGLTLTQIMTLDLVLLMETALISAVMFLPAMWPIVPLAAISALVAATKPDYAPTLSSIVINIGIIYYIIAWNREISSRVQAKKAG